jgi:hypothetical protein
MYGLRNAFLPIANCDRLRCASERGLDIEEDHVGGYLRAKPPTRSPFAPHSFSSTRLPGRLIGVPAAGYQKTSCLHV